MMSFDSIREKLESALAREMFSLGSRIKELDWYATNSFADSKVESKKAA